MSTTQVPQSHEYDCEHAGCDETFLPGDAVDGSFCSTECSHRFRGQKLLNTLEEDHKFCANCGTQVKVVEPPTNAQLVKIKGYWSTKALEDGGGYQYRTQHGTVGEIGENTGTICGNCGNCTLSRPFPETQSRFLFEYADGILDALEAKREEGTHDKQIDQREFYDHLVETTDLPLALGRAIDG